MAVLGLRFCARAFSSCGKQGPLIIAVHGPLAIEASLVAEHRLQTRRLSSCGVWASHFGDFSCCGARALGVRASVVVARGLSSCGSQALEHRLSSCGTWALEPRLSSCSTRA